MTEIAQAFGTILEDSMAHRNNFPFGKNVVHAKGTWGTYLYSALVSAGIEDKITFKRGERKNSYGYYNTDITYFCEKKLFGMAEHESVDSFMKKLQKSLAKRGVDINV